MSTFTGEDSVNVCGLRCLKVVSVNGCRCSPVTT